MIKYNLIRLQASEGKYLTDGERFVKVIDVEQGQSEEVWTEVAESVFKLHRAKQVKVTLNDRLRDEKLLSGVTYQDVLFDSDTDQKVNLLATVGLLEDDETITWYGMDNKALLCTVADLLNIGALITKLHSYCWNMNAYIKEQIADATTMEELNNIEIDYSME